MSSVFPLAVRGLSRRYGQLEALHDFGMEVGAGECVALWLAPWLITAVAVIGATVVILGHATTHHHQSCPPASSPSA